MVEKQQKICFIFFFCCRSSSERRKLKCLIEFHMNGCSSLSENRFWFFFFSLFVFFFIFHFFFIVGNCAELTKSWKQMQKFADKESLKFIHWCSKCDDDFVVVGTRFYCNNFSAKITSFPWHTFNLAQFKRM